MFQDREALQKSAQKHLAAGRVQQAIDDYQKILKDYPNDWALLVQVGDLYLKLGQSAHAIPLFQRVAEHHCSEGFLLKAIAIYKRIHRLDPGRVETRLELADVYFRQGLITDARFELLAAVDHYESMGLHRETIRLYHKLIEFVPDDLAVRSELARIYERINLASEAVGQYLEISNDLLRHGKVADALSALENARRLSPRNAAVLWKMLWVYLEEKEFARADQLLEEFISNNTEDPEMLGLIVKSFLKPDQAVKMMELIDRAPAQSPQRESLRLLKGELFLRTGDVENAFIEFVQAIEEMLPDGRHGHAIALMRRLTRHDATFHPAWELLVDLYIQQGQESNLPAAYSSLADACIAKSLFPDARKCLEQLLEIDPGNRRHRERLEFVCSILDVQESMRDADAAPALPDFDLEVSLEGDPGNASGVQLEPEPAEPGDSRPGRQRSEPDQ